MPLALDLDPDAGCVLLGAAGLATGRRGEGDALMVPRSTFTPGSVEVTVQYPVAIIDDSTKVSIPDPDTIPDVRSNMMSPCERGACSELKVYNNTVWGNGGPVRSFVPTANLPAHEAFGFFGWCLVVIAGFALVSFIGYAITKARAISVARYRLPRIPVDRFTREAFEDSDIQYAGRVIGMLDVMLAERGQKRDAPREEPR